MTSTVQCAHRWQLVALAWRCITADNSVMLGWQRPTHVRAKLDNEVVRLSLCSRSQLNVMSTRVTLSYRRKAEFDGDDRVAVRFEFARAISVDRLLDRKPLMYSSTGS